MININVLAYVSQLSFSGRAQQWREDTSPRAGAAPLVCILNIWNTAVERPHQITTKISAGKDRTISEKDAIATT